MRNFYGALEKRRGKTFCFRFFVLLCLIFQPLVFSLSAYAAITQTINYQGFLLSKLTNLPVETPQDIKFVIYDAASAGSALFTETRCNVPVHKGRYDVEIGSVAGGITPASIFTDYNGLWLEMQLDANGDCVSPFEPMSPRVRLQASPFAFNSLYASTASAAAAVFAADTIAALPQTAYGGITISTNLFVQGGISVGNLSIGQKLSVAGIVESSTGGFKFPDGSVQLKASALTMWDVNGPDLYTINPGNVGIGEALTSPLARLHISSGTGADGNLLLVSTGSTQIFLVNGLGQVYGGAYYGDGATLTGIVRKAGDVMTGQLTLAASSLTVTSALGLSSPKFRFLENVEISSAPAAAYGGIQVSTHIYLSGVSKIYGDGSGLTAVISTDSTKVLKAGDTMTGSLAVATLTVTGNAFSVAGATFSVLNGNTAVGGASYLARLTVNGGIIATSSVTAQGGIYSADVNATRGDFAQSVRASSATFWGWGTSNYSIESATGIKVNAGSVIAPYFVGNGSQLTSVTGTDSTRVLKAGDAMTGNLLISGSSLTVASGDSHPYALTVASAASVNNYSLAVTTGGYVGVRISNPSVPLEVNSQALISNTEGSVKLGLNSNIGYSYLHWSDSFFSGANPSQGVLGYLPASRNLVFRTMGSDPATGGSEVFRIKSDDDASWLFGIGTANPTERFHLGANMLVSTSAANPILYISTTSGRVSINTAVQSHALTVNGGIKAVSSVTTQGGFYGQELVVGSITAIAGGAYDGVVFSTSVYIQSKLAVGEVFEPAVELHVRGTTRLEDKNGGDVILDLRPANSANAYIRWREAIGFGVPVGVLGFVTSSNPDLVYRGGANNMADGVQAFRIKPNGNFIMGNADTNFVPSERFHVVNGMVVGAVGSPAVLFISTGSGSVGISTGTPQERMHVASSFLVGTDRVSANLYVSTQSGYTGIGTGAPQTKLDVNGSAQFGSGVNKSTFTIEGFWQPRGMTTTEMQAASPPAVGAVVFNSTIKDLCVSTGAAAGQWALAGSKGIGNCFN